MCRFRWPWVTLIGGTWGSNFSGGSPFSAIWPRTTKFCRIMCWEGAYFKRVSDTYARGGPNALQFGGFPSIYAYTLWRITTKFDVVTDMGRGLFLSGHSATPHPKGAGSKRCAIWGFLSINAYTLAGPRAWNKLPPPLRRVYSAATFKRQLKTFLYNHAFNWHC